MMYYAGLYLAAARLERKLSDMAAGAEEDLTGAVREMLGVLADETERLASVDPAAGITLAGTLARLADMLEGTERDGERAKEREKDREKDRERRLFEFVRDELLPAIRAGIDCQTGAEGGVCLVTEDESELWAGELKVTPVKQVICMFGYGDGSCYSHLRGRASKDSVLIVYEPEKDSLQDFREQLIINVDYFALGRLLVCAHPGYDRVFAREYADFVRAINENRERILVNKNTMLRFRENASANVIKNLHMLREINLVSDLSEILPKNIPVVIVAAGPSLDRNVLLLKEAKGHCLIVAVDTALKYLLAHDIIPDLAITVEPIKPMANYEDDRCFDVPHIFDAESNPDIVGRHRSRKFLYNCRDYVRRLLEAMGRTVPANTPSGGSVATAAFAVFYGLGTETVILIGQDLAYDGDATHAGGIESKGINNEIGTELTPGINGGMVRTRSDWTGYRKWFESGIRVARETGRNITVVDATEGGALIKGTEVMTLREAIDRYCVNDYSFDDEVKRLPYMIDESGAERLRELTDLSFKELQGVRDAATEGAELCDRYIVTRMLYDKGLKSARVPETGRGGVPMKCTICREICEGALMYPLINNYAVCDVADEIAALAADTADAVAPARQQLLAFKAIVKACDYFDGLRGECDV